MHTVIITSAADRCAHSIQPRLCADLSCWTLTFHAGIHVCSFSTTLPFAGPAPCPMWTRKTKFLPGKSGRLPVGPGLEPYGCPPVLPFCGPPVLLQGRLWKDDTHSASLVSDFPAAGSGLSVRSYSASSRCALCCVAAGRHPDRRMQSTLKMRSLSLRQGTVASVTVRLDG